MKKKSLLTCAAVVMVFSLLCGCGSINVNINTNKVDDNASQETGTNDDQADLEKTLESFPQLTSEDYDLSKYDGDTMYFECHGNTWSLTDESAKQYPNLVAPLKEIDDNRKKYLEDNLDQYDDEAKQYEEENRNDENFFCYASYADTGLVCADPKVVSLVTTQFDALGGAHPTTTTMAYNLDAETGQDIPLSAVISDKKGLNELIKEVLIEQYTDHSFFGIDESLDSLDMALPASKDSKPVYVYSFAPDGLTFYFDPTELSPHSDGGEQVYLTFDQLSSVLQEHYK